jgi:hypothetical protein
MPAELAPSESKTQSASEQALQNFSLFLTCKAKAPRKTEAWPEQGPITATRAARTKNRQQT